jgi:exosortase/archaeosortase
MLLDQVSQTQIQAGSIVSGAAMVVFLAAPMFRRQAQAIRIAVTVIYLVAILGAVLYFLFFNAM